MHFSAQHQDQVGASAAVTARTSNCVPSPTVAMRRGVGDGRNRVSTPCDDRSMDDTAGRGSMDRVALRAAFRRLGLIEGEVELWVEAEAEEGTPQLARYRFLSALWPKMIDSWRHHTGRNRIARRLLAEGPIARN